MKPADCFTIAEVARALGVEPRIVRGLIERRHLNAEQPNGFSTHRFLHRDELRRYEQLGYRVQWRELRAFRELRALPAEDDKDT